MFTFDREDAGFCRVYYCNTDGGLYCIQDGGNTGMEFFRCSKDGEPEYAIEMPGKNEFDKHVLPGGKKLKTFDVTVNAEATDSLQAVVSVQATTSADAVAQVKRKIENGDAGEWDFQFHSCDSGLEKIQVEEQAREMPY